MMKLSSFRVEGFRSLANIEIPLYDYTILIGRNNSGKSAVLLALKLLLEGTARDLSDSDFYTHETQKAEQIVLEAVFEGVGEYLPLCDERHRTKIANCVIDDRLRIRRLASRSPLGLGKLELWQPAGNAFGLPTGIENALKQLLPEPIFIEAFKDPNEEAQAKSSATLGKLLKQIVEQVSAQLESEVKNTLDKAARRFNVIETEGKIVDERPEELRRIEQRIRQHMQAVFEDADVRLRFRLPEIDDLMASATVELRDRGPWTPLEGKGQGFQRALYLALLRALAEELRATGGDIHRPFLLLFEEPEAFLHPALQREMGNILESISESNQVIVATHSPLLVTSQRIQNVLILRQTVSPDTKLQATCCLVPDPNLLPDPEDKQLVNLLRFSSSAEFLFADCVLVVEGPSDRALLEASWHFGGKSWHPEGQPLALAVVEAGSKVVVPVWANYLRAIGLSACGVVDLDFLWDGAGKCLGADPCLSQFAADFWRLADQRGISEIVDGKHHISPNKKADAFALILQELNQQAQPLRERLQSEAKIWVLAEGEIENYFGLSSSSKGQYAAVSQKVRNGEVQIHSEIETILKWATSPQKSGAG
ncbi:MAG: AAA family ATPase [candidate division KSB1 bacterium]|nr:AAA family ATPase [candidate division KSB1 bacterium]MDZ7399691.1 AAA family ATPase [candidate division KSB1 bacterium]